MGLIPSHLDFRWRHVSQARLVLALRVAISDEPSGYIALAHPRLIDLSFEESQRVKKDGEDCHEEKGPIS